MADPLSIAASLAGLLSVAGKISSVVIDFISSINDVPASARAALQTVEEMRVTLSSAKLLMDQLSQMPRERKEMIHVRHLVIIFRESILSMSDLEAIVCLADDGEKASKWDRVKWLLEETKVLRAVERIGAHQSSLSTMLNILQCQSDIEARECLFALQNTVQEMVQKNEGLLRRLEQFDPHRHEEVSVRFFDDNESVVTLRRPGPPSPEPGATEDVSTSPPSDVSTPTGSPIQNVISPREFEVALEQTRVYARVQSHESDISFTSSAVRTHAWSILSGLSLNDISVVSVLALPITLEEINNIGAHLTFARLISGVRDPAPPNGDESWPLSSLARRRINTPTRQDEHSGQDGRKPEKTFEIPPPRVGYMPIPIHRLVVLGDDASGKMGLTIQFFSQQFDETYDPSVEASYRKLAVIDGQPYMLEVYDTSGQDEYLTLWDQCIRAGNGFVLVYSITSRRTFSRLGFLHSQILRAKGQEHVIVEPRPFGGLPTAVRGFPPPMILVGSSPEGVIEREVPAEEGRERARQLGCEYIEVSVGDYAKVEKAFYDVIRAIRKQQPRPPVRVEQRAYDPYRYRRRGRHSGGS